MSWSQIEEQAHEVIRHKLPKDLWDIYSLKIETRIIKTQEGSLLIFFGALIAGIELLSKYKNLVESIQLIREHTQILLRQTINKQEKNEFDIDVDVKSPYMPNGVYPQGPSRDAFFWYLLISNILLLATVGLLVGSAVAKTYFQ